MIVDRGVCVLRALGRRPLRRLARVTPPASLPRTSRPLQNERTEARA
jgi:hypothetical protein